MSISNFMKEFPKINWREDDQHNIEIENYFRLVVMIMNKYSPPKGLEWDDMFQIGVIALLKAKKGFDPDKGILFSTYAARCVHNEYLMEIRKSKGGANVAFTEAWSMDSAITDEPNEDGTGNGFQLYHVVKSIDNVEDIVFAKFALKELLDDYQPKNHLYKKAAEYHMEGKVQQRQMGKELGVSQSYASRLVTTFKKRAADYFGIEMPRPKPRKKEDILSKKKRNKSVV